jgi:hypothetical protein
MCPVAKAISGLGSGAIDAKAQATALARCSSISAGGDRSISSR